MQTLKECTTKIIKIFVTNIKKNMKTDFNFSTQINVTKLQKNI